jgi:hypothetical protein
MMRTNIIDNRDPRWSEADLAIIDAKVEEAMALVPRLTVADDNGTTAYGPEERRWLLTSSFRDIVKATSLDNLVAAPPALLEQFSVLALIHNENVKGELVQLIRVFMIAYAEPRTNRAASSLLDELEALAKQAVRTQARPELFKWKPLPGSAPPASSVH